MDVALDDRAMRDDHALEVDHEVGPAEPVLPVVVSEPLLLVVPERGR